MSDAADDGLAKLRAENARHRHELLELLELTKAMRTAQRGYFRSRTTQLLEQSKAIEKKVDALIEKHEKRQATLFGGQ